MSKKILVVEDTEDNRQILRDLLGMAGYEMVEAHDGAEGVAKAAEHKPDLILMDIQMPVMDGYEATRRIKADSALTAIPISPESGITRGPPNPARAVRRSKSGRTCSTTWRMARRFLSLRRGQRYTRRARRISAAAVLPNTASPTASRTRCR